MAALGRRAAELCAVLDLLEIEPASERVRDDLRRRIHALAAGARLLRFTRLAERLTRDEALLAGIAARVEATPAEITALRASFEQVPAIAWGEASVGVETATPPGRTAPRSRPAALLDPVRVTLGPREPEAPPPPAPQTALVVGAGTLADALSMEGSAFEVEHAPETRSAIELARAMAPDVIVLDADRSGARELCEALASDPLTEEVPIVVVGMWSKPDDVAPYLALGVARSLPKPVSPDTLRRACADATATYVRREVQRSPLGDMSVDELGARLAEEMRRGLCDATVAQGRGNRIHLGEGTDVLAALWGAVARIRDLVTIHSSGAVRFAASGPEGALPIAPWLSGPFDSGEIRSRALGESRAGEASLERRVVVVADDDPAVTWFLAGVLRAAGAIVHEAHDGARALEIAHRVTPDLVISDVLMPICDGFALCRALKRDLVLRDVPVILLSWKEDLLQRVRELGGGADGYLRKEASAAVIVHRCREVMLPRQRVAERLARGGEVRGRLDGLTTRTLLGLTCALRPDAQLTVRDSAFLYEIEIRAGRPVRATRTSIEGDFQRGAEVLGALLGVGAGRFVVAPADEGAIQAELVGSLDEQLLPRIAAARAAQRLLSGTELVAVERVELAEDRMAGYGASTPEPARSLLCTIAAGASPRALITSGQAAARLTEDVLCDAAAHGAVSAVFDAVGTDLLAPAIAREVEILRGTRVFQRAPVVEPVLDLGPVIHTSTPAPVELVHIQEEEEEELPIEVSVAPPVVLAPDASPARSAPPVRIEEPIKPPVSSEPVAVEESRAAPRVRPLLSLGSLTPPPVQPAPVPRSILPKAPPTPVITPVEETPSRAVRRPSSFAPDAAASAAREAVLEARVKDAARDAAKPSRSMWGLFAVAGIVFAVGARLSRDRELAHRPTVPPQAAPVVETRAPEPQAAAPVVTAAPAPSSAPAPAELKGDGANKADPILPHEGPLRADDQVPPGQGMLEVVAGTSDTVFIDGTQVGNGPVVKRALAPRKDPYEIRVKLRGEERVRFVLVKEGRLTRLRIAPRGRAK
ncbi:Two-component hybrid sensor and regulator [Minicystis rosea]|nr:Two-component hybrid sensor and regulator [Minicystis rosea]